jgi:hypothetical protein
VKALGIGPRDVLDLARHVQRADDASALPLLVTGVLAEQLADALAAGGDRTLVRTSGDPAQAAALVRVVGGAATAGDEAQLRAATRALVPVVVVQTGSSAARIPYVLATDVVDVPPGQGFPIEEIATLVARSLGSARAPLAARLPVLRRGFERGRIVDGAVAAGSLAAFDRGSGAQFPALALAQARMLSDVLAAGGAPTPRDTRAAAQAVAPPLVAAVVTGLVARTVVRRLPVRGRLVEAAVAAGVTAALASVAARVGSVRSRT